MVALAAVAVKALALVALGTRHQLRQVRGIMVVLVQHLLLYLVAVVEVLMQLVLLVAAMLRGMVAQEQHLPSQAAVSLIPAAVVALLIQAPAHLLVLVEQVEQAAVAMEQ